MSFGKIWAGMYEGSMFGAGLEVMAVWPYMLARADRNHRIEMNPRMVSAMIGCSPEDVEKALAILEAPDPNSRSKDYDGRRIIKEGEFQYYIPNRRLYCLMENDTKVQIQNRIRKRKQRFFEANAGATEDDFLADDKMRYPHDWRDLSLEVVDVTGQSRYVDVDIDSSSSVIGINNSIEQCSNSTAIVEEPKKRVWVGRNPPTLKEVHDHILSKGFKPTAKSISLAEEIIEHHENGGNWKTSKGKKIYVWKSHVNQWINNRQGSLTPDTRSLFAKQAAAREIEEARRNS